LDMVVTNQAEDAALGKDGDFVIKRTIAEVEGDSGRNAITMGYLGGIATSDGDSFDGFKGNEAMGGALGVAHWNRLPMQGSGERGAENCAQANRYGAPATGENEHESLSSSV
jgi:hypothetical protein